MEPTMPTPEEMAKLQKSRTESDADLLKDGAEYVVSPDGKNMKLDATKEQKMQAEIDMELDMESLEYKVNRDYYKELTEEQLEEIEDREDQLLRMETPILNHLIEQMATLGCGIDAGMNEVIKASQRAKESLGGGYDDKVHIVNTGRQSGAGTVELRK